jgi:hypothetical protein
MPGFRIVYSSDTTRGLYCEIDEKDVTFGGTNLARLLYSFGIRKTKNRRDEFSVTALGNTSRLKQRSLA